MVREFSNNMGALAGVSALNEEFKWIFGEVEPIETHPFLNWGDTTNDLWKQRNATNDGWIVRGILSQPYFKLALNVWIANKSFDIGDICYPLNGASYKRLECVVAGTTGATEPVWTGVGTLVNDGSVTWIVDDIRDGALPGDICDPSMIVRAGRIKTNGAVISRVAYPRLFRFASNNNLIVSEANWSGGYWGLFGAGDGSTTFRMPDIRGVDIRGYDDSRGLDPGRVLGTYQADAIQNITGSFNTGSHNSAAGAFYIGSDEGNGNGGNSDSFWNKGIVGFDASRVVRTAAETHSKNIDYYRTMKY